MSPQLALPMVVNVELDEWLTITGKGQNVNFSVGVPGPSILNTQIDTPGGYDYILFHGFQWDGITPGTVTFELRGGMNSTIAGFAVQQFIQDELFITDKGVPLRITINNASVAPIVANLDYVLVPARVWEDEVLTMLRASWRG